MTNSEPEVTVEVTPEREVTYSEASSEETSSARECGKCGEKRKLVGPGGDITTPLAIYKCTNCGSVKQVYTGG